MYELHPEGLKDLPHFDYMVGVRQREYADKPKDHAGTSVYWDPYQDRAQRMCRQDLRESCLEVRGTSEKTC